MLNILIALAIFHIYQVSAGETVGYIKADDRGEVWVDGVLQANTTRYNDIRNFTVSDSWRIIAVHAVNGDHWGEMEMSIQPDAYTNRNDWVCTGTYTAGWTGLGFDDSGWGVPILKRGGQEVVMDARTERIWFSSVTDLYCRHIRDLTCNVVTEKRARFLRTDATTLGPTLKSIGAFSGLTWQECSLYCLERTTKWRHVSSSVCYPPDDGCYGYVYNNRDRVCHLYTSLMAGQNLNTPNHSDWGFFIIQ